MAQVDHAASDAVDHVLGRAMVAWETLPDVEQEIDTWDLEDQIVYLTEWQIEEDRLLRLAMYEESGALTAGQRTRYERLLRLVEERRPIIERLLRG